MVAIEAALIILVGIQRPAAMSSGCQSGDHRIVAASATFGIEGFAGRSIDAGWIGMPRIPADLAVTVHAHDLAVRRGMPVPLVHQPIGMGITAHANYCEKKEKDRGDVPQYKPITLDSKYSGICEAAPRLRNGPIEFCGSFNPLFNNLLRASKSLLVI
jgi:hypothetical protein